MSKKKKMDIKKIFWKGKEIEIGTNWLYRKALKMLFHISIMDTKPCLFGIGRYTDMSQTSCIETVNNCENIGLLTTEKIGRDRIVTLTKKGNKFVDYAKQIIANT